MNIVKLSVANLRRILNSTLASSIALTSPAPQFAAAATTPAPARALHSFHPDYDFADLQGYDPMFKDFAREAWAPPTMPAWARRELDADPYFMRSQSFTDPIGDGRDERTAYAETSRGLRIQVPGVVRALEIERNLKPLFEVDDYVFLRAGDDAMFRARFAANEPEYSEGLFFIDKQYVYAELARGADVERRPVPVFFLPLAGRWTGTVRHVVAEPFTTIALRNDLDAVTTIDLATLRTFARGLHHQVQVATMIALKHDPDARPGAGPLAFTPPPPGSTALFGTFLTGMDLAHPDRGVVDPPSDAYALFDLLPKAHALVMSPDLWDRLARVAIITSNVWMLGTALQYTRLRTRMLERRQFIEDKEDEERPAGESAPDRTTLGYRAKRAVKENIDVFSTGLAVLATGPDTVVGYVTEYLADRSGFRFARNGWFRKAQEHTFLFSRAQNEGINVNWKAFYLGVAILGTIDTAGVTLQLLWATPFIMPWVASFVSEHQQQRALDQFSGHNENTNNLVTSEIMRNLSIHFVQGSYGYARDQRNALMEVVRPQVEREFQLVGKSIQSPAYRAQYEGEIKRRVEKLLVQRQLPPEKEFLFSSPSIVRTLLGTAGYRVDRAALERSVDFEPNPNGADDADDGPNFMLETARHGSVLDALKIARAELNVRVRRYPARAEFARAERIVAEMQRRYRVLVLMARHPGQAAYIAREAYQVRKILTLLSQEGPVTQGLKYLDLWTPADPAPLRRLIELKHEVRGAAARAGTKLSRRALFAEVGRRAELESPAVALAFSTYAGRGRTFEAQLVDIEADHRDGILGAALRDPVAAEIAGRTINQSLQGLIADRPDFVRPGEDDVVRFGAEARIAAAARVGMRRTEAGSDVESAVGSESGSTDADVELETLNVIKERVEDAAEKKKNDEWRPAHRNDLIARLQEHRAHRAALREVQRQLGTEFTPVNRAFSITDLRVKPIYTEAYRRSLAAQVGLHAIEGATFEDEVRDLTSIVAAINAVSDRWFGRVHPGSLSRERFISGEIDAELRSNPSAFARHQIYRRDGVDVLAKLVERRSELALNEQARAYAEEKTARNLSTNGGWKTYLAGLDDEQTVRFVTHQYADAYLGRYADLTVGTSELVPQTSPAQPGFFQNARQANVMATGSRLAGVLTTTLRVLESPFDASSIRPGTVAMLKRRVPFLQDTMSDTSQRVKRFGIFLGITWPMQWYLWGVHFDAPQALLFYGTAGSLAVAHYWVDRMLVNVGKPPMADTWSKIKYSLLITTVTYPTYIPFFLMEEGWREIYTKSIEAPFLKWTAFAKDHLAAAAKSVGHAATELASGAADACQNLLSAVF